MKMTMRAAAAAVMAVCAASAAHAAGFMLTELWAALTLVWVLTVPIFPAFTTTPPP